ncbi:MAG TPA: hypothetical protein DEG17_01075 [Cyanobacteria bacterium UBA11149]|nr:hypothetical protein [Cyanobacteria bacterium UBA11367]HBE59066.1 hypothetical protein [Cyanobacteria bacterium UBA11366]HBK66605.1 hypothetical protein [Cyanobacteria bacterium UBA11166]HBR72746.1 hypothetical protein [Cyanobacteria bacterium UBA11159]HBS67923.1 hypothetical protein [Cyanobacteria bacterium UBA11153]HBW87506.1 hypothetical protein [Cyanobacteria bacterium UBA11149]HCA94033.1 hypothetical protein [Cyanobacteria bacterium UBA9226]
MPEYTITLKIPNAGNREISHSVFLADFYEDYPEDYFKIENNRSHLCQTIEAQSARQISKEQLKRLIDNWIQDIKQGRRRTTITLDLLPEGIPTPNRTPITTEFPTTTPTYQPPPKKPNPSLSKPKITPTPNPPPNTINNSHSPPPKSTLTEKQNPEPTTSIEAATNEPDF